MIIVKEGIYKDEIVEDEHFSLIRGSRGVIGNIYPFEVNIYYHRNDEEYLEKLKNVRKEVSEYDYKDFDKIIPRKYRLGTKFKEEYNIVCKFENLEYKLNVGDYLAIENESYKIEKVELKNGDLIYYIDKKFIIKDIDTFNTLKQEALEYLDVRIKKQEEKVWIKKVSKEIKDSLPIRETEDKTHNSTDEEKGLIHRFIKLFKNK